MMSALMDPDMPRADPLALSPQDRAWVERTRDGLSTEQKIAQLFILSTRDDAPEEAAAVRALRPGGIHRFPSDSLDVAWQETRRAVGEADVPPLLSGDIEGGAVSYPFATPVPNQMGIAACADLDLSARIARVIATESAALGYNWSFTPVVDLARAFRSAVVGTRAYGADVEMVLAQARVHVRTLQAHGLAATAKHWPGEGLDDRDQHLATTVNPLDMAAWEASFGRLFRALIDDGLMTVMSAHIALPAFARACGVEGRDAYAPASVSRLLNQDLLRGRLGFRGLIVSDATPMGGLTGWMDRAAAVPAVIENGCDMFLFSRDAPADIARMVDGLRTGRLSEARLEEAVTRILSLKAKLGLHRTAPADRIAEPQAVAARLRTAAALDTAREAFGRSLTLVKDTQSLLPIDPLRHRRVAIIADHGHSFFAGAPQRDFGPFRAELEARGHVVRDFDPDAPPTPADTDLLVYLLGQEATPVVGAIRIDYARLHGGERRAMQQFNREVPVLMVSLGQPFFLYDAPNVATYVNAYASAEPAQRELVRRLAGEAPFEGASPVDPYCGLDQLRW